MLIICLTILLIFFNFNLYTNYFHHKWFFYSIFVNALASYFVFLNANIFLAIFIFYMLCLSGYYSLFTLNRHFANGNSRGMNIIFSYHVLKTHLALLSFCLIFTLITKDIVFTIFEAVKYLVFANLFLTFIPKRFMHFKTEMGSKSLISGFGANTSVNSTFTSLMLPFCFYDFDKSIVINSLAVLSCLIIVLKHKGSAGIFASIASCFVFFILYFNFKIQFLAIAILISILLVFIASLVIQKYSPLTKLLSISGRENIMKFCNKWIMPRSNKWFGIAPGGLASVYPTTHEVINNNGLNHKRIAKYIWLHCDVYQLYVENGRVGLILGSIAYFSIIAICIFNNNIVGLAFIASYTVNSLTNFPNHLAPDSFLTLIMMKFIFIKSIL